MGAGDGVIRVSAKVGGDWFPGKGKPGSGGSYIIAKNVSGRITVELHSKAVKVDEGYEWADGTIICDADDARRLALALLAAAEGLEVEDNREKRHPYQHRLVIDTCSDD